MRDTDLAWAAGFLDADGCFGLNKQRFSNGLQYFLIQINCGQAYDSISFKALSKLKRMFGGSISGPYKKGPIVRDNKIKYYPRSTIRWNLSAKNAWLCCKRIEPFLVMKREQAKLMIDYFENKSQLKYGELKRPESTETKWRNNYYLRMRELNRKKTFEEIAEGV